MTVQRNGGSLRSDNVLFHVTSVLLRKEADGPTYHVLVEIVRPRSSQVKTRNGTTFVGHDSQGSVSGTRLRPIGYSNAKYEEPHISRMELMSGD